MKKIIIHNEYEIKDVKIMNKLGMTGIANICFDRIYEAYSNEEISDSEFAFLVESVDDKFEYWYEKFDFGKTPNPDKELKLQLNSIITCSSKIMKDLLKYVGNLRKEDNSKELTRYSKDNNIRVPSAKEISSNDVIKKLDESIDKFKKFWENRPSNLKLGNDLKSTITSLSSTGLISDINTYSTNNGKKGLDGLEKFYWVVNDYKTNVFDKKIELLQDAKSHMSEYLTKDNRDGSNDVGMALR